MSESTPDPLGAALKQTQQEGFQLCAIIGEKVVLNSINEIEIEKLKKKFRILNKKARKLMEQIKARDEEKAKTTPLSVVPAAS